MTLARSSVPKRASSSHHAASVPGTPTARSPTVLARGRHARAFTTLLAHVLDELLRRVVTPLADERFFRRQQVTRRARVEPVGVGPALVHAAPRIAPVVVDLAAEEMPAHAPHVL